MSKESKSILIKSGRVIDPANAIDHVMDLVVEGGIITNVTEKVNPEMVFDEVLDAKDKWVLPGLMDMHVHLREPGREDEETVETGTRAAAAGGFTSVACMANTQPVIDDESKVRYLVLQGQHAMARVYPVGTITKGMKGSEISPIGEMVDAGAVAISEDGYTVKNANLMRNALNYCKMFNVPLIAHCEDEDLVNKGYMNEGKNSAILGMKGIPSIAEDVIVARDLILAEYLNARIHIAHVSTAGSVRLIRDFKARGVPVTAETAPHYFTLDDEFLTGFSGNAKMNPPLRTQKDIKEIKSALADGTIDVIASDHAPHSLEEKTCEIMAAANGIVGLETSLALTYTHLVKTGLLTPAQLIERMSIKPNEILSLPGGTLGVSRQADITLFDPNAVWTVNPDNFHSNSKNTPFEGAELFGKAYLTIVNGEVKRLGN